MRMYAVMTALVMFFLTAPAAAQGPKWFYCYAPNPQTGVVHYSEKLPTGPVSERRGYGEEFSRYLSSRGLLPAGGQAYCTMRATEEEIAQGQRDLQTDCAECEGASSFNRIAWKRGGSSQMAQSAAAPSKKLPPSKKQPYEIAAPLPVIWNIALRPRPGVPFTEHSSVQVHTRFFLCGDNIKLSYSLRPVPRMNINQVGFKGWASVGRGTRYPFNQPAATMTPGHKLGCNYQTLQIAKLSDHEQDLIQHQYINGDDVWSREDQIKHMLGRFTIPHIDPWP